MMSIQLLGGAPGLPTTRDIRAEICNLLPKPGPAIQANAINGSLKFDLMVQRTTRADMSRKPKSYLGSLFMYPLKWWSLVFLAAFSCFRP